MWRNLCRPRRHGKIPLHSTASPPLETIVILPTSAPGSPKYDIRKADPVKVPIQPVTTKALKIEIDQPENFATGLYEWEVETAK